MRRSRPARPILEALDDRVLLSQTAVVPGPPPVPVTTTSPTLHLTGNFRGGYTTTVTHPIPDVGRTVSFTGLGTFEGHRAYLAGSIHLGGFIQPIDPGQVTITTATGSLTLKVYGAPAGVTPQSDGAILLDATIVRGTGAYQGLSGSGTAKLVFTPMINVLEPGTQVGKMTFSVDLAARHGPGKLPG